MATGLDEVVLEKERTITTDDPCGTPYALDQRQVQMCFPKRGDWKRFLSPGGLREDKP